MRLIRSRVYATTDTDDQIAAHSVDELPTDAHTLALDLGQQFFTAEAVVTGMFQGMSDTTTDLMPGA